MNKFQDIVLHDNNDNLIDAARVELALRAEPVCYNDFKGKYNYKRPLLVLVQPLKSIEMPIYKFTFILASYAFQNLKDEDLAACVQKCMLSLLTGGVLLMRESIPDEDENYFD